ncbi:MAG: glycosyltransferase family 2 protein [Planctomycetes bacterium]|nr:glycosyltransferase family 2 protein [Planctomycetota bacterium]
MTKPLVSAIIPTYQRPELVRRAVRCVLAQTWRPLELVVVDDGSKDATQQVLGELRAEADNSDVGYRFEELTNGGVGRARTRGMELASGSYFAFLDDDDEWLPAKVATQLRALRQTPDAGVSFTRYMHGGADGSPKPKLEYIRDGWVFETLCDGRTRAHQQTLMIRREVFERIGGFTDHRNFQDFEYCLRASLDFPFKAVPDALTVIHTVESSISREVGLEGDLRRDKMKLLVLEEFSERFSSHDRYDDDAMKHAFARVYDEHVKHLLWLGRVREARASWEAALARCGELPVLTRLKGKLARARMAGWFGIKLKKPE